LKKLAEEVGVSCFKLLPQGCLNNVLLVALIFSAFKLKLEKEPTKKKSLKYHVPVAELQYEYIIKVQKTN
jgi:hypothetical protein